MTGPKRRPLPNRPAPDAPDAPTPPATQSTTQPPALPRTPATEPVAKGASRSTTPPPTRRRVPTWLDARSWVGAIVLMCIFGALLWAVEIVNLSVHYRLDRFGIRPRAVAGLWGVLTQPFLHKSAEHMASNTLPVILIGWVVMLAGLRSWLVVSAVIVVIGGLLAWLIGPAGTVIVGASSLVFGWMGYLLARAVFSRRIKWILVAVAVLFFYGTLLAGLLPSLHTNVSWQANVGGFAAGVVVGAVLHPRGRDSRLASRTAVL